MPAASTVRHVKEFDASQFNQRVDIVGCGATGSKIALSVAKLGVRDIHVWDDDIVEGHNIANQAYGMADIGKPKVQALAELIYNACGIRVTMHNRRVTGSTDLGNVVFILTDDMDSRMEIYKGLKNDPNTKYIIETRMGVDGGRLYCFNPCDPLHCEMWESRWYPSTATQEAATGDGTACDSKTSVGPTADFISATAGWRFMHAANHIMNPIMNDAPAPEMIFKITTAGVGAQEIPWVQPV